MNTKTINIRALAFLGDAVFSLYVRRKLLENGINNPLLLQKRSIEYVSAKSQRQILEKFIDSNFLTEKELEIVRRGRNYKNGSHPKNTDIITYKLSTGFEALIGDLYINNQDRLVELLKKIEVR